MASSRRLGKGTWTDAPALLPAGVAGGLTNLSKMPACNIMLLGAQRKTLSGFSSTSVLPHTGYIYHSDIVQSLPPVSLPGAEGAISPSALPSLRTRGDPGTATLGHMHWGWDPAAPLPVRGLSSTSVFPSVKWGEQSLLLGRDAHSCFPKAPSGSATHSRSQFTAGEGSKSAQGRSVRAGPGIPTMVLPAGVRPRPLPAPVCVCDTHRAPPPGPHAQFAGLGYAALLSPSPGQLMPCNPESPRNHRFLPSQGQTRPLGAGWGFIVFITSTNETCGPSWCPQGTGHLPSRSRC